MFKILDVPKKRVNAKLVNIYIDDQTDDDLNSNEFMKLNKIPKRIKGKGRPTKKERRKLDDINN
jgi:ribosome-associated heat shock protein Hsp15